MNAMAGKKEDLQEHVTEERRSTPSAVRNSGALSPYRNRRLRDFSEVMQGGEGAEPDHSKSPTRDHRDE